MNQSCLFDNFYLRLPVFRAVLCIIYGLTTLTAVSLNLALILTIWKTPHLHKPSYILLANVAFVDLLVGAIVQTSVLGINIAAIYDWAELHCYSMIICRMSGYWLSSVSLYTLTVISIDRLLAIKLKNRYRNVVTSKRIWMALLPWWFGSFAIVVVFLTAGLPISVLLGAAGTLIVVMLATLTICYSLAFYLLKRFQNQTAAASEKANEITQSSNFNASKYKQSLKTMVLAICLVLFSYLPYMLPAMTMAFKNVQRFDESETAITIFKFLLFGEVFITNSSTINPILFLWRMKELRQAAKSKARKLFRRQNVVESFSLSSFAS